MPRRPGHVTNKGAKRHLTEARLWSVLRAATRLVDGAAMLGTTPTGERRIFAVERGAMLALATKCNELRTELDRQALTAEGAEP